MKQIKIILILILFYLSSAIYSSSEFNLKNSDIETLISRDLVIKLREIKNTPWPEVTIYSIVRATPLECISVFTSYDEHKDFIPDLLSSKTINQISKTDIHIAFELNIPWPLSNSKYITGNRLSVIDKDTYQVKWYFVKSDSSKDNYGKIIFKPFKEYSLILYRNFTYPKSSLAKFFKGKMIKKTKKTVIAIRDRIEYIKDFKPLKMQRYIKILKEKLNID